METCPERGAGNAVCCWSGWALGLAAAAAALQPLLLACLFLWKLAFASCLSQLGRQQASEERAVAVQGRGGYLPPAPHGPERGPGLPRAGSPVLAQASASPRRAQTCMPPPAEAQTPRLLARPPSLPQPLPRRCPPPPSVAGAGGRQAPLNPP